MRGTPQLRFYSERPETHRSDGVGPESFDTIGPLQWESDRLSKWKPGDRLIHRFNPELGPGVVRSIDGRTVEVEFPRAGSTLRLAAASDALGPLILRAGVRAQRLSTGETSIVRAFPLPAACD